MRGAASPPRPASPGLGTLRSRPQVWLSARSTVLSEALLQAAEHTSERSRLRRSHLRGENAPPPPRCPSRGEVLRPGCPRPAWRCSQCGLAPPRLTEGQQPIPTRQTVSTCSQSSAGADRSRRPDAPVPGRPGARTRARAGRTGLKARGALSAAAGWGTRTELLFADYLEFCAREPGTPGLQPRTREAAALRTAAEELRRRYPRYFERYHDYNGNRAALLDTLMDALLPDGFNPTWLRVVTCAALAGTLLQHPGRCRREEVARDCVRLVARLCVRFAGRHRAWLEAQGGWDGFCLSLRGPLPISYWKARLVQTFLSCILATVLIYLWTRVYRFM